MVPESNPASTPPTAIADRKNPRVCGPPPNRSSLIIGNRATGIARVVAARSERNDPRSTGRRATYRQPSAIARRPARCTTPRGGIAGSRATPYSATAKVTASTR